MLIANVRSRRARIIIVQALVAAAFMACASAAYGQAPTLEVASELPVWITIAVGLYRGVEAATYLRRRDDRFHAREQRRRAGAAGRIGASRSRACGQRHLRVRASEPQCGWFPGTVIGDQQVCALRREHDLVIFRIDIPAH